MIPGGHGKAWSDEDVATLRQMAREGAIAILIARKLQRSRESVANRACRLKIPLGKNGRLAKLR